MTRSTPLNQHGAGRGGAGADRGAGSARTPRPLWSCRCVRKCLADAGEGVDDRRGCIDDEAVTRRSVCDDEEHPKS